jgi:NADP-dependent 3-hydroxy acid dehydrogenase YdfG
MTVTVITGAHAAAALGARFVQLDVTDEASVRSALATIRAQQGVVLPVLTAPAGATAGADPRRP